MDYINPQSNAPSPEVVTPSPAVENIVQAGNASTKPVSKNDQVRGMLKAGFSIVEVCEALNANKSYVYKIQHAIAREADPLPPVVPSPQAVQNAMETADMSGRKKNFLMSFYANRALLMITCRETITPTATYYIWMTDPEFAARVFEIKESMIDFVEQQLFNQIQAQNTQATTFFLKTRGKERGYVDRTEVTGKDGEALQIRVIEPRVDAFLEEPDDELPIIDVEVIEHAGA